MKTLSVHQPWASLIVKGIKNIENRSWQTSFRGKILIHASATPVEDDFYENLTGELYSAMQNETLYGNLEGNLDNLPTGAIVGYVELEKIVRPGVEFEDASYDQGAENYRWMFGDAYEFDEPIMNVKGRQGLYDTPEISEDNLPPAHRVEWFYPSYNAEEKTLFVPVNSKCYEYVLNGNLPICNLFLQQDMWYFNTFIDFQTMEVAPVETVVLFNEIDDCIQYVGLEVLKCGIFSAQGTDGEVIQKEYVHADRYGDYVHDLEAYVVVFGDEVNVDRFFIRN